MADKFYDGMLNVNEELNKLNTAFEKGPYNALPLTGGNLTGPVVSTARITADSLASTTFISAGTVGTGTSSSIRSANNGASGSAGTYYEVASYGVAGIAGAAFSGRFFWTTCGGFGSLYSVGYRMALQAADSSSGTSSAELLSISGQGDMTVGRRMTASRLTIGPILATGNENSISGIAQAQGEVNLRVPGSATFFVTVGVSGSAAACAMNVGRDSNTGRGMNVGGTVNASGADYAEYMIKGLMCGTIAPGQIVGIDAEGKLTDKWDRAIAFVVKSTNPCMVGGDSWAQHLGARPAVPARVVPTIEQVLVTAAVPADEASGTVAVPPVYDTITTAPGDTDEEWAAKQEAYATELAAFELALEGARQTVDRIAFAGQVPVNIFGAQPGDYIVPVQDGAGIKGVSVHEDDLSMKQYFRAVGRVISIEPDGRAYVMVKVV